MTDHRTHFYGDDCEPAHGVYCGRCKQWRDDPEGDCPPVVVKMVPVEEDLVDDMSNVSTHEPDVSKNEPSIDTLMAELRAALDAATPGPWVAYSTDCGGWGSQCRTGKCEACKLDKERNDIATISYKHTQSKVWTLANTDPYRKSNDLDDAKLIVKARNALPRLLDELERLQAVGELRHIFEARYERQLEENERLRSANEVLIAENLALRTELAKGKALWHLDSDGYCIGCGSWTGHESGCFWADA